jgi:hypothetical protein
VDPQLRPLFGRTAVRVAHAEEMPIGAALFAELEALSTEPIDAPTAVRLHALWAKLEAHLAARKMMATQDCVYGIRDQLLQPASVDEAEMLAAQELACATHIPYSTARNQLAVTARVAKVLPMGWEALDRGELTLMHIKAIERATAQCAPALTLAVDARIVPLAVERGWTPSETGKAARKLVLALDPKGAAEREEAAKSEADVTFYPQPDGVATLDATGDALLVRQVFDAINDTAEVMRRAGDDRPVGLRRFHALADAVLGRVGGHGARRPAGGEVLAVAEITTLLGHDDHPGELVGYGPISADATRRIAADHRLRRLVTDPLTGEVKDLGRRAYAPSNRLRKAVQATSPTCTAPGCCRPAIHCEIDHRLEFDRGGCTNQCNLKPLCKMHHDMKTRKRWRVDVNPDGSETWTSHLGFTYVTWPNRFPLPDPMPVEDEPPAEIADRLPDRFDPDPPGDADVLPEPPPLTDDEYEAMERAVDTLDAFGISFRQWCDRYYDEARRTGLVA